MLTPQFWIGTRGHRAVLVVAYLWVAAALVSSFVVQSVGLVVLCLAAGASTSFAGRQKPAIPRITSNNRAR